MWFPDPLGEALTLANFYEKNCHEKTHLKVQSVSQTTDHKFLEKIGRKIQIKLFQ